MLVDPVNKVINDVKNRLNTKDVCPRACPRPAAAALMIIVTPWLATELRDLYNGGLNIIFNIKGSGLLIYLINTTFFTFCIITTFPSYSLTSFTFGIWCISNKRLELIYQSCYLFIINTSYP